MQKPKWNAEIMKQRYEVTLAIALLFFLM